MSYFNPHSTAWWSGVGMIVLGILQMAAPVSPWPDQLAIIAGTLTGGQQFSPAYTILTGLSIIGIRAKQERGNA